MYIHSLEAATAMQASTTRAWMEKGFEGLCWSRTFRPSSVQEPIAARLACWSVFSMAAWTVRSQSSLIESLHTNMRYAFVKRMYKN